jgi:hypothetical protein
MMPRRRTRPGIEPTVEPSAEFVRHLQTRQKLPPPPVPLEIKERLNDRRDSRSGDQETCWESITRIAPGLTRERVLVKAARLATFDTHILQRDHWFLPPGERRDQVVHLSHLAAKLSDGMDAADEYLMKIYLDLGHELRDRLDQFRERCHALKPQRAEVKKAGNKGRLDLELRRLAAFESLVLLIEVGVRPTVTNDGAWIELTEILFYIATGRESGDAKRACTYVRREILRHSPE